MTAWWLCPQCGGPVDLDPDLDDDEYDDAPCMLCIEEEERLEADKA